MTVDALAGYTVVELSTGVAGAYATKLFADAGADVIVVEPEAGSALRRTIWRGAAAWRLNPSPALRIRAAHAYLRAKAGVRSPFQHATERHRQVFPCAITP